MINDPIALHYSSAHCALVLKLDTFLALNVNVATTITSSLLLVLLLCKTFAPRDNQILVSLLGVIIWDVSIAGQSRVHLDVLWNPGEWDVILLGWLDDRGGWKWW